MGLQIDLGALKNKGKQGIKDSTGSLTWAIGVDNGAIHSQWQQNREFDSSGQKTNKIYPFALLVGIQIGAATMESSLEIPQKIKNGSTFWPSDPTSGNISEGTQNTNSKERKHPYVHCSIIYNH